MDERYRRGRPRGPPWLLAFNLQIVLDVKSALNAFGAHPGYLLIHLIGDNAFQTDLAIFHDDVNRWRGPVSVPGGETLIAVNGAVGRNPNAIVSGRKRENFDVIHHISNTLDL